MAERKPAQVAVVMGSDSDLKYMEDAIRFLQTLDISLHTQVLSAHRTPVEMSEFAQGAEDRGLRVIIAGAGGAAHLPGMIAAHTSVPVIGVPVPIGPMQGEDALLSIVQMPKGVPVATVAIGNSHNAGILAAQILAFGGDEPNQNLKVRLREIKAESRRMSLAKEIKLSH